MSQHIMFPPGTRLSEAMFIAIKVANDTGERAEFEYSDRAFYVDPGEDRKDVEDRILTKLFESTHQRCPMCNGKGSILVKAVNDG